MSDELTARLVTDRLNGIDTIALAHEEVLRYARISITPIVITHRNVIMKFIDEFNPYAHTVGDHLKNEIFAHKAIVYILLAEGQRDEHIVYHENKIESLSISLSALNVR